MMFRQTEKSVKRRNIQRRCNTHLLKNGHNNGTMNSRKKALLRLFNAFNALPILYFMLRAFRGLRLFETRNYGF